MTSNDILRLGRVRLPKAFAASVVLIVLAQAALLNCCSCWRFLYLYSDPLNDDPLRMEATMRMAGPASGRMRVLITGSSQAREDFDMEQLNGQLAPMGAEVMNLGISGGAPPVDMYMLADRYIRLKPQIIVYMPYFGSFYQGEYDYLKMRYYFSAAVIPHIHEALGLGVILEHAPEFRDAAIGKTLVVFRYREFIQRAFDNLFVALASGELREKPKCFAVEQRPPSYFEDALRDRIALYVESEYAELNRKLFKAFARRIADAGIELVVIDGPTHPLITHAVEGDLQSDYNRFLGEQAGTLGYIYISAHDMPDFDAGCFADFTHLNSVGRAQMTRFMAGRLQAILSEPEADTGE